MSRMKSIGRGLTAVRGTASGVLSVLCVALSGSCSSPIPECNPPIEPGTQFNVTVVRETPESNACHIVVLKNQFLVTAARENSIEGPSCTLTPANWAPTDTAGIQVIRCEPSHQMLGTECEMKYPAACIGNVNFYFYAPPGSTVDWSAPTIQGVRFRVRDHVRGCIPDLADCLDEYEVNLQRM